MAVLGTMHFVASAEKPEQRNSLPPLPEIALCGRSNVGKSSLINALGGSDKLARVSRTPGRTRLINTFNVNGRFYLVDLPGYGFARASHAQQAAWGDTLPAYLASSTQLALALVLCDFRLPPQPSDAQLCEFFRQQGIRYGVVATKADGVPRREWHKRTLDLAFACKLTFASAVYPVSSQKGWGLQDLANAMLAALQ